MVILLETYKCATISTFSGMIQQNEIISKVLLSIEQYKGSIDAFRSSVLRNEYTPAKKYYSRLLLWKACVITETLTIRDWEQKLALSRVVYHKLRQEQEMSVQWHLLDEDNEFYLPQALRDLVKQTQR